MIGHGSVGFLLCYLVVLSWFHCGMVTGQFSGAGIQLVSSLRQNQGIWYTDENNGTVPAAEMDVFRLPGDLVPVSYDLLVDPDLESFTYTGRVQIVVTAVLGTCQIVMNAKDLHVIRVGVVDRKTNQPLTVVNHQLVDRNEQLIITLNGTSNSCLLLSRSYVVMIDFAASLRNDMSGFYRSWYKEDNVTKWLAVTKFEPTYARKAFPCFDEPSLKAPFNVSIKRRLNQISLSNMPLSSSTRIERTNTFWDIFHETPPISTYLVGFFVGEFYAIKTLTTGVYTQKKYISQAEYIANKSPKLIEAMENFTGVDYMLPKLDLLAIPDFAAGAMENWGMNTYRERLLLLPENSKTKIKEYVTTVVQHELSHQWFGDLVTCAWWDYLWLNEGFATFFEYFATKMVEPTWRLEDVFVYEVHQEALAYDQTPNLAISGSVKTPAEIKGKFDDISYSKAGAVLRMFQYAVTETNFREALNFYLTSKRYAAATPEDLWNAFDNVLYDAQFDFHDNFTVTEFMKSWTEQAGYPVVNVTRVNNTFMVTQERFLVKASSNVTDTTRWIVGLTYTTESRGDFNDVIPTVWLKENKTVLPNQTETGWYIFNLQSIGFFRVNYDRDNWNALIDQLNKDFKVVHVLNRAQLLDDAFNLALADRVDYTMALRLSKYLVNEDDVVPWYSARNGFAYLLNAMRRCSKAHKNLKTYVSFLAGTIWAKTENLAVHHKNTDHSVQTGWNAFSSWACKLDNEMCTKSAFSYFLQWRRGENIPPNIRDAAFCVGVRKGGPDAWNTVLDVYVNSDSPSERQSAQLALGCSEDLVQLSKYLDFMFEGLQSPIRPQDFRVIYQTLASTSQGIAAMIDFLTKKLDRIVKNVINGEIVATSMYSLLASRVARNEEIKKIGDLRLDPSVPEYLRKKFNSSYRAVEENTAWFKKNHFKINDWMKNTINELRLNVTTPRPVDISTKATPLETSSEKTPRSSSTSLNPQILVLISQIICSVLVYNTLFNF